VRVIRQLVRFILRSTARGPLVEALPPETRWSAIPARVFRAGGRLAGLFLTRDSKAAIQDWLINRFRIEVAWQSPGLEACLRDAIAWLAELEPEGEIGDYLEFGVYQGNTLITMHQALERTPQASGMRLFGFDSFQGLPPEAAEEGVWSPGQYRCEREFTEARLAEAGVKMERVKLVEGFYADSLTPTLAGELGIRRAGIVMVDCDLYSSSREALEFCRPLFGERTVILFDDWHSTGEEAGEKKAFSELLKAEPGFEAEEVPAFHSNGAVFRLTRKVSRHGNVGRADAGAAATLAEHVAVER
jgi:O-methyltransferase